MGRTVTITQEQVNAACLKILQEGNQPTVARLRTELGSGSATTINTMLRVFKDNQDLHVPLQKRSAEIESAFFRLIQAVELEYKGKITALEELVEKQKEETTTYLTESEKHLEELTTIRKEYKKQAEQITRLKAENGQIYKQLQETQEKNTVLLGKAAELESSKHINGMLQAENTQIKEQLNTYLERAVAAEKELELLKK